MKPFTFFLATLTALILLTQQGQSQSEREVQFYKGGLDTLTKNVFKNVIALALPDRYRFD